MSDPMRLRCTGCGTVYDQDIYSCPRSDGILEPVRERRRVSSIADLKGPGPGIWQYRALLPAAGEPVSLGEGNTPLIESRDLGPSLGLSLYFKDEGRNPTGSFKDRAASVMVTMEKRRGPSVLVTSSSGNAACAVAAYGSAARMRCVIFMYHPTQEKLITAMAYRPQIYRVDTPLESEVLEIARAASRQLGWRLLNTAAADNPFILEGYKTIAFELYEQMGGEVPDYVVCPSASGSLLLGVWKGYRELMESGLTRAMPRMVGVQPESCSPICRAFREGLAAIEPGGAPNTCAGGLVLEDPGATGQQTLDTVRRSGGAMVAVTEEIIRDTLYTLPAREQVFGGPSGVAGVAGLILAARQGIIPRGARVVCVVSESAFKGLALLREGFEAPPVIRPDIALEALRDHVR